MPLQVVTNAGPLLVFSKLNILHLFKTIYGHVIIPGAVYNETVETGLQHGFSDAHTLRLFLNRNHWTHEHRIEIPETIKNFNLDRGEKEAISLAMSKKALLLIDEERGREAAKTQNISVRGSLGILIEAYRKKHISEDQLRFYFQDIIKRNDIWISRTLCTRLLKSLFENQ